MIREFVHCVHWECECECMCSGFVLGAFSHAGGEAVGYLEGHGGDSQERESEGHRCEQLRSASSAGALCALHHPSFGQPGGALDCFFNVSANQN